MLNEIHEQDNVLTTKKECRICGDAARGLNFNVLTCVPCKNFFRRNAYKKSQISICQFDKDCSITKRTRGYCSYCRLKKCLALGMDPELIRIIPGFTPVSNKRKSLQTINKEKFQLPQPLPLGLLQNDRSTLASREWTLLSNMLHVYEDHNPTKLVQHTMKRYSALPPKMRLKPSETVQIIREMFTSIGPLIENSPDFATLSNSSRQIVTKHNLYMTGSLNGLFLCRELNLLENLAILDGCCEFYGHEYMARCSRTIKKYDPNGVLVIILTFILTFSSNCSIVTYNSEENISTIANSVNLIRIQDVYTNMLWKYLIYLYGFEEAVLRFTALVKCVLDIMNLVNTIPQTETRHRMVDSFIIEIQHKLVMGN